MARETGDSRHVLNAHASKAGDDLTVSKLTGGHVSLISDTTGDQTQPAKGKNFCVDVAADLWSKENKMPAEAFKQQQRILFDAAGVSEASLNSLWEGFMKDEYKKTSSGHTNDQAEEFMKAFQKAGSCD